jgi:hypothetical protein
MTSSLQSGFQRGETLGWAAAYSVYPQPVQLKDILGAVGELAEWNNVPAGHKIELLSCLSKKRINRRKTIARINELTAIRFIEVDTASDLKVVIVLGKELAKEHAHELQRFAQGLYENAGYTNSAYPI